jgi:general secretion pathway protein D
MRSIFLLLALLLAIPIRLHAQANPDLPPGAPAEETITLELPNNPVQDVLALYEQLTGKNLVRDAALAGTLSIIVRDRIPKSQAIALIESSLLLNGYSLVPVDEKTSKIVGTGRPFSGENIPLYNDIAQLPDSDQLVSFFMPLQYLPLKAARDIFGAYVTVRPNVGKIIPVDNANALVITENVPVVRRIVSLKYLIDVPGVQQVTKFVQLERADSEKVVKIIEKMLENEKTDAEKRAAAETTIPTAPATPPGEGAPTPAPTGDVTAPAIAATASVQIVSDPRTNRVIVVAPITRIEPYLKLIRDLDAPVDLEKYLERPLKYASAAEVLPVLGDVLREDKEDKVEEVTASTEGGDGEGGAAADSGSTGGGTSGGGGIFGGGGAKPDRLRDPKDSTEPRAISVGRSRIIADRAANKIIVIGPPESRMKAAEVLNMLDQRPKQVYLATVIGQLTLGKDLEVGFDYLMKFRHFSSDPTSGLAGISRTRAPGTDLLPDPTSLVTNAANAFNQAGGLTLYGTIAETVDVYARALATTNRFKVISRPVVYTANNKRAIISSGQSVPIPVESLTSVVASNINNESNAVTSSIQYKDVVLKLEVIPLVNSEDQITLEIAQQNDSIVDSTQISGNSLPVIATQELKSTVTVPNRNTVILGGLITDEMARNVRGIPFLSDIPGLGYLFSNTRRRKERRELVVLIQPLIVNNEADVSEANVVERNMMNMREGLYDDRFPPTKNSISIEPEGPPKERNRFFELPPLE